MTFRRVSKDNIFFSNQQVNGVSSLVLDVADFRNCIIQVAGSAAFVGSIFIAGAIGSVAPVFVWKSNNFATPFSYLQAIDLADGSASNGNAEGIEIRGTTLVRHFEVNINSIDWITVIVTAVKAGAVKVIATVSTNL